MAAAVFVNLAIYTLGAVVIGGTYRFTSQGQPATVDALTVIGFTAVPIGVGMALAALLPARWRWVTAAAVTVTIVVGIGSIFAMPPLQTDLDAASRIALWLYHYVVTAVTCAGLLALRAVRGRSDREGLRRPSGVSGSLSTGYRVGDRTGIIVIRDRRYPACRWWPRPRAAGRRSS